MFRLRRRCDKGERSGKDFSADVDSLRRASWAGGNTPWKDTEQLRQQSGPKMGRMNGNTEYKCVVVGDGGVGKTSMLIRYVNDDFLTEYMPTCFDSYSVPLDLEERQGNLVLVDTAGQETYDRLRTLSYYNTDIFIVCFSVASVDSFLNVRSRWVPELHDYKPGTPFLLVGTQADLRHSPQDSSVTMVPAQKAKKLARKVGALGYLECSALTGSGLDRVFRQAVTYAMRPQKKRKLWSSFISIFVKR